MNRSQDALMDFLKKDHGSCTVESPLESNPLAQELGLKRGDIIASFPSIRFILWGEGGITPLQPKRTS